jgi:hypothetical protein
MSHTTSLDGILFTDMDALRSAIDELKSNGVNCDLLENATPRAYYKDQSGLGKAPFVVRLNSTDYDVGLYEKEKGAYEARADFWAGKVSGQLGAEARDGENTDQAKLGKLYQMYAVHAATRQAVRQGYNVHRVTKDDGTIQLRVAA